MSECVCGCMWVRVHTDVCGECGMHVRMYAGAGRSVSH